MSDPLPPPAPEPIPSANACDQFEHRPPEPPEPVRDPPEHRPPKSPRDDEFLAKQKRLYNVLRQLYS